MKSLHLTSKDNIKYVITSGAAIEYDANKWEIDLRDKKT